jgi:hypothetical protein
MSEINVEVLMQNAASIKEIIRMIRRKEGGVGSKEHELVLSRAILDIDMLMDTVNALKEANTHLRKQNADLMEQLAKTQLEYSEMTKGYEAVLERKESALKKARDNDGEADVQSDSTPE